MMATVCTATNPAVSVLNLLSPKEMGMNFFDKAFLISWVEKSPSGPIKIVIFSLVFTNVFNNVFSSSSQWAIHFLPLKSWSIKSLNLMGSLSFGNVNFKDCLMADWMIFSNLSCLTNFRSEFWQIIGVI